MFAHVKFVSPARGLLTKKRAVPVCNAEFEEISMECESEETAICSLEGAGENDDENNDSDSDSDFEE